MLDWIVSRTIDLIAAVTWAETQLGRAALWAALEVWPAVILIGIGGLLQLAARSRPKSEEERSCPSR